MSQYEFRKSIALAQMNPKNFWKISIKKEPTMKQVIMLPLPLDQKGKRKERELAHLIIPSKLMVIWPIEYQDLQRMNYNCVLHILNTAFID